MATDPTVFVVDDDDNMRRSLEILLGSVGLNTESFNSAEDFLAAFTGEQKWEEECPRCLILDVRLTGLSGLGLLQRLNETDDAMPVILITAYGSVSMAVKAMRDGALDYIEKPFSKEDLLKSVSKAIDRDADFRRQNIRRKEILARFSSLSTREREVMDMLIDGDQTQQIARGLKIGAKTVAKHRGRLFEKMRVNSMAALVSLAIRFSLVDDDSELDDDCVPARPLPKQQ